MAKLEDTSTTFEGNLPTTERMTFKLKSNPKMFSILSDGIYSDKIMAVIRELSCNAYDASVMSKNGTSFKVNVPTQLDSNFWVEDTGLGIDPEKIVDIFWTYGASTKTDTNDAIGALGLGSKSPFAYTKSSFLVINRYNGMEYKYFCFINEHGVPDGNMVFKIATTEPNGVRVELAVRQNDIGSFRERIIRFYSYWDADKLPTFAGDQSVLQKIKEKQGKIYLKGSNWDMMSSDDSSNGGSYAVMGGVPYRINKSAIPAKSQSDALSLICDGSFNIRFPIGSLNFQVSREELAYDDRTIAVIVSACELVVDELMKLTKAKLENLTSPYELAAAYREVINSVSMFRGISRKLSSSTFTLVNGKQYTGNDLTRARQKKSADGHLPIDILKVISDERTYVKGKQYWGLKSELEVMLEKELAAGKQTVTQKCLWYKPKTKPVAQISINRKRTPANFLFDGYAPKSTEVELNSQSLCFIVNDIGERGQEGMRFYTGRFSGLAKSNGMASSVTDAYKNNALYFVDGFDSDLSAPQAIDKLNELFAGTLLEGAPVQLLSALPDFKLPVPVKALVSTGPRAAPQRGMIEQRFFITSFGNDKELVSIDEFDVKIDRSNWISKEYVKHDVTKPMLYLETDWGTLREFGKAATTKNVLGCLNALGMFDRFIGDDKILRIALLSSIQLEECQRKKVELVNMSTFLEPVAQFISSDLELIAAFQERLKTDVYMSHGEQELQRRVLSLSFKKHCAPHLLPSNVFKKILTINSKIEKLLTPRRIAALFLVTDAWSSFSECSKAAALLAGKQMVATLSINYPLLEVLSNSATGKIENLHLAHYINAIDKLTAVNNERLRVEQHAAWYADALFEM